MLNKDEFYNLIDKVLAKSKYFTAINVFYKETGLTRFANSEIHQNVYTSDYDIKITVINDKKIAKVSTNIMDEEALFQALREAEENLEFLPKGDYEYKFAKTPDFIEYEDEYINSQYNLGIKDRADILVQCINSLEENYKAAGILSRTVEKIALGTTEGIKRFLSKNSEELEVVVMHRDGSSGYAHISSLNPKEFDVKSGFHKAYNKAKLALNPITLEPGTYDVILEPEAVFEFVMMCGYMALNQDSIKAGSCFLDGKKGKQIMNEKITIKDDYKDKDSYMMPFDFEGYERKTVTLIEKGIFKNVVNNSKLAELYNEELTGHSLGYGNGSIPLNMVVDGGQKTLDEIVKSTKKALLITRFHYINVVDYRESLLTGLTRDGVFIIENGEIKEAVKNMRFTEGILNAFNNVEEISSNREKIQGFFGHMVIPAMKIKDFHFTGKTE
ncbi:TldD/PmbA family protein [Clostridium frigidicarnis]|uniref:Predicted Zn-dependent protease or its inactivated homolog n=1 Tax=Clostridium frigidicarnis TaxID=84698 RepID=A0A1I0YZZ1_9CLOT|nr:TldD/PmbA family protein [Clostridium frigidicarnis]SFB18851.1 Predicted Zn-dependent protease or its inactivated homolog [Clostridium frigidicarnis]